MSSVRIIFCICLQILLSTVVYAVSVGPAGHKNTYIAEDYKRTKQQVAKQEEKQRRILSALYSINKKMKKIVVERGQLERERMGLESSVQILSSRINQLEVSQKEQRKLLLERLAVIYKVGGQGVFRLLFNSKNSSDLERNLKILGLVAANDVELIRTYNNDRAELLSRKEKLQKRLAKLKDVETKIHKKEKALLSENEIKTRILVAIKKSMNSAMNKLDKLRIKNLALNDEDGVLDLLFRPSFFEQKGKLKPPVEGKISQDFGIIKDDTYNVSISHKGLFISAPPKQSVKSVFEGRVAFVGDLEDYGSTVIIDHGDHYYTVYSNLYDINVKAGEEVSSEQKIAQVGTSVIGTGTYFEIRHFSEPYDPKRWVKGTHL